MKLINIVLIVFLLALFGCEDKVKLDLPEGEERLVVDGIFTSDSVNVITLSKTAPYFETGSTPRVTDANLYITSNTGDTILLNESIADPGNYTTTTPGEIGKEYTLHIRLANGQQFESLAEKMNRVSPIDSIYYEIDDDPDEDDDFKGKQYIVYINSQEIPGKGDYYRWIYYVDGEFQNTPDDLFFVSDELADGSYVEENDIAYEIHKGEHVRVTQLSITQRAYQFWTTLSQQTQVGSIFDAPPAPVKGNVFNKDTKKSNALGFFGVSAASSAEIIVQ